MRAVTAMIVAASILVGCGGGDSGGKAGSASPAVVRSDDGRAKLTLPLGVDAKGISVKRVEREGAAAAYELLPAGMKFDKPATLTITGVPAPEGNQPALAILESEDDKVDMVDGVATTYTDGKEGATVALPIGHFSIVTLNFLFKARRGVLWEDWEGTAKLDTHVADIGSPDEVIVDEPFEVFVRIAQLDTRVDVEIPMAQDQSVTVERVRASGGSVTATNATPRKVENLPPDGELGESYSGTGTFRCTRPGIVDLNYTVDFTFDLDWDTSWTFPGSRSFTSDASVSIQRLVKCYVSEATTTTRPKVAASKPEVTEISITLRRPVSTYTVTAIDAGLNNYEYEWKVSGEACGTPRTPWTQSGRTVTWSHSDNPPDSCSHATQDHLLLGSVTVRSGLGPSTTCTFEGSETKVIKNPTCS